MNNAIKYAVQNLNNPHSLKSKLAIVLVASSLIPLMLIGLISLNTITFEMKGKVQDAIQSNLRQVRINMENTLNNLDYVSRQLAYGGPVAEKFIAYLNNDVHYYKYLLYDEIRKSISLVLNTNPNVGTIFYYLRDQEEILFYNNNIRKGIRPLELPLLSGEKSELYYGPHISAANAVSDKVFSIVRRLDTYFSDDYFVYVETNPKLMEELLDSSPYPMKASHILTDYSGKIVYNSGNQEFPIGEKLNIRKDITQVQEHGDMYLYNEISQQGWNIFAAINRKDFDKASNSWLFKFILLSAFSIIISLFFVFLVYRMIYKPMRTIKKEIALMAESDYSSEMTFTNVLEFDELLEQFHNMKDKVIKLLSEVENRERIKRHLEVEKLMHQINPHFLHNTLNTVQWLARSKGQTEIARLIALFTKVLHYNMGKEGISVTIEEEIGALNSYIELQKIRYDYEFDVRINADKNVLDAVVPRFILQPLVENSLYHGVNDEEGCICVDIQRVGDTVRIIVSDNGAGMDENEIKKALNEDYGEHKKVGLGIGISYVNKMIRVNYGEKGAINIQSRPGETRFIIEIPYSTKIAKESGEMLNSGEGDA